ncbi:MAG: DNA mismatch repair protein MutS [Candidatus Omnitrophica bacterium]|nr:DNA mismatch repair protein MutS [Candidatus Omnitrophota bacterium]
MDKKCGMPVLWYNYHVMENLTPMLKQYNEIKKEHPGYILFFRLGDFYEMFYDDAKTASAILDLVLTARSAGSAGKAPMCGIPYHSADSYISRLIKAGCKVAVCEQVEDPAKAKGIVKREVVRLITSGTFIDENNPDSRYILSLYPDKKGAGIAFIDNSGGGTIYANEFPDINRVVEIVSKIPVCECIFPSDKKEAVAELFGRPFLGNRKITLSGCDEWMFNNEIAKKSLCDHFKTSTLAGFGVEESEYAIRSAGGLIEYLRQSSKKPLSHVTKLSIYTDTDYLYISPSAVYGLEIDRLAGMLDSTVTPMGKRMLKHWIYHPLLNTAEIKKRQEAVKILIEKGELRAGIIDVFKGITDVEKALSKISCGYGSGVKEILAINNLLVKIPELMGVLKGQGGGNLFFTADDIPELREFLSNTVESDIPAVGYEGKFVKKGYRKELDELRDIRDNVKEWLRNLQKEEIKRTGINSLKIGYNSVFGYYIEITKANLSLVPEDYIRKQTLVNAERFVTPQLKEFEEKILTAESKILTIEKEVIEIVKAEILENAPVLYSIASSIAVLDVLCSFANAARENDYVRPEVDESFDITIKEGRHPVVEKMTEDFFVPNDSLLDNEENHFLIITGPNMAGKSTYIRQVALIAIMAQAGSFVPAKAARIGLVDKIFTRIGAHDEISRGQSTFMVEMTETAGIINNLSKRSLVVLDEIGRGTGTYDGFSLAWAVAEYLVKEKARTLFATHFHELTGLEGNNGGVKNYNVAVRESGSEVVFLHKIMPGGTDESYGIYVAQIAGIPPQIIKRADEILSKLELQGTLQEHIIGEMRADAPSLFMDAKKSPYKKLKEDIEHLRKLKDDVMALNVENTAPVEVSIRLKKIQEELKNGKD